MTVKYTNAARCVVCDQPLAQVELIGDDGGHLAPKRVVWCPTCSTWRRTEVQLIDR